MSTARVVDVSPSEPGQGAQARLYTAGDDVPDLSMMFPTLLTNAYRVEAQRVASLVHWDLQQIGIEVDEFERVGLLWQRELLRRLISAVFH